MNKMSFSLNTFPDVWGHPMLDCPGSYVFNIKEVPIKLSTNKVNQHNKYKTSFHWTESLLPERVRQSWEVSCCYERQERMKKLQFAEKRPEGDISKTLMTQRRETDHYLHTLYPLYLALGVPRTFLVTPCL